MKNNILWVILEWLFVAAFLFSTGMEFSLAFNQDNPPWVIGFGAALCAIPLYMTMME